jgi:hypothetical protein
MQHPSLCMHHLMICSLHFDLTRIHHHCSCLHSFHMHACPLGCSTQPLLSNYWCSEEGKEVSWRVASGWWWASGQRVGHHCCSMLHMWHVMHHLATVPCAHFLCLQLACSVLLAASCLQLVCQQLAACLRSASVKQPTVLAASLQPACHLLAACLTPSTQPARGKQGAWS